LGGLPMISEVARSSANVNNGAKTRWANFFHGVFLLIFMLFLTSVIQMIPKAALAAMLIGVGIKLAHPKEFVHMLHIGKEQLAIFVTTIVVTLGTDLLVGIGAGILLKALIHLYNGAPLSSFFKSPASVSFTENDYVIKVEKAAIFTNFLGLKSRLEAIPPGLNVTIDLSDTQLIDHTVMEALHLFQHSYQSTGGIVTIVEMKNAVTYSAHPLSARKKQAV
jgi:MFS superfamily sulfate permease-like transporter